MSTLDPSAFESEEVLEEETIPTEGTAITLTKGSRLEDLYDKYQKLIYLIDVSGSMGEGMLPEDIEKMYVWTPDMLAMFRAALEKEALNDPETPAKASAFGWVPGEGLHAEYDDDVEDLTPEQRNRFIVEGYHGFMVYDDEVLKSRIISHSLASQYNIQMIMTFNTLQSKSKLEVVKDAAKDFVKKRFEKYPEADVIVMPFDDSVLAHTKGGNYASVMQDLNNLRTRNGTDIGSAVMTALREFKARKSEVGAHHIILITDAESHTNDRVVDAVPQMRKLNVVLDLIYVMGQAEVLNPTTHRSTYKDKAVAQLKQACSDTGGEYVEVTNAQSFTEKFLKASTRLCLPLPPEEK